MREVSVVIVSGPLSEAAGGFGEYLTGLGYAPLSIELRLRLLAHVSRWLAAEGLSARRFDVATVQRFLSARQATHQGLSGRRALEPLLRFLRSTGMIPQAPAWAPSEDPVEAVLEQWAEYLGGENGLQSCTVCNYRELARPFLESRRRDEQVDIAGVSAADVSGFVSAWVPGMSVGRAKLTITALRSLLRFLHASGQLGMRLDGVVPAQAGYRDCGVPRGLAPQEVAAVITACDPATTTGARNRAVVLLLARLGLRAQEVRRIDLGDIDWRAGTLRVHGKGGLVDVLPVPVDVGEALAVHLSNPRPAAAAANRAVFIGSRAPYRRLAISAVTSIVQVAGRRAGLSAVGSHRLRHSVATATINAGASLEETAQLLRHRSLASTTIYAKVDLTRLRSVARPWPLPAAATPTPAGNAR